jgi:hypothetical protein
MVSRHWRLDDPWSRAIGRGRSYHGRACRRRCRRSYRRNHRHVDRDGHTRIRGEAVRRSNQKRWNPLVSTLRQFRLDAKSKRRSGTNWGTRYRFHGRSQGRFSEDRQADETRWITTCNESSQESPFAAEEFRPERPPFRLQTAANGDSAFRVFLFLQPSIFHLQFFRVPSTDRKPSGTSH